MRSVYLSIAVGFIAGCGLLIPTLSLAQSPNLTVAPVNQSFLNRAPSGKAGAEVKTRTFDGHATGYIPSPIDFSFLRKSSALHAKAAMLNAAVLPATYDLRKVHRMPPINDQGYCGSCWDFAAVGGVETGLARRQTASFSEQYIADTQGTDIGVCDGGWEFMAVADMAAYGIVPASQSPYRYLANGDATPALFPSAPQAARLTDVEMLAVGVNVGDGTAHTNEVKQAIVSNGAGVSIAFLANIKVAGNGDYVAYDSTAGDQNNADHEVEIIGWNDNYPAVNFASAGLSSPPANGAWLIRNSWGAWWGNQGYFWLSYYDDSITIDAYSWDGVASMLGYSYVYQYDMLGWTAMGDVNPGQGQNFGWMANVFRANKTGQNLNSVSFYTTDYDVAYTVQVYDKVSFPDGSDQIAEVNPRAGVLKAQVGGKEAYPGYHTVSLPFTARVTPGWFFSVVVKVSNPSGGNSYPIALQYPIQGVTDRTSMMAGQSFVSADGSTWTDLARQSLTATTGYTGPNVCVKAFGTGPR